MAVAVEVNSEQNYHSKALASTLDVLNVSFLL